MRAERLSCTVCLPSLMRARIVFRLKRGHTPTHKVTDATDYPTVGLD